MREKIIDKNDVFTFALLAKIPVDEVKTDNIFFLSPDDVILPNWLKFTVSNGRNFYIDKDKVYTTDKISVLFILGVRNLPPSLLNKWQEFMRKYNEALETTKRELRYIREYEEHINDRMHRSYFQRPDRKKLIKAARAFRIKIEFIDDSNFWAVFRNVKVGDEEEGYINYKEIRLRMNDVLLPDRIITKFRSYWYDSNWSTGLIVHPHISSSGSICWGNRDTDVELYRSNYHYDFYFDVLNETVHSYNNEEYQPYLSITEIRAELDRVQRFLPHLKHHRPETIKMDEEERSYLLWQFAYNATYRCTACGEPKEPGKPCTNNACDQNPSVVTYCEHCNTEEIVTVIEDRVIRECYACHQCEECGGYHLGEHCENPYCPANPDHLVTCEVCEFEYQASMENCPFCAFTDLFDDESKREEIMTAWHNFIYTQEDGISYLSTPYGNRTNEFANGKYINPPKITTSLWYVVLTTQRKLCESFEHTDYGHNLRHEENQDVLSFFLLNFSRYMARIEEIRYCPISSVLDYTGQLISQQEIEAIAHHQKSDEGFTPDIYDGEICYKGLGYSLPSSTTMRRLLPTFIEQYHNNLIRS